MIAAMRWLRSILKLLILAPIAAAIVLFAIGNRAPTKLSFDPLAREAPAFVATLPLYVVVLIAIGLGVIAGGLGAWFGQSRHRKAERALRRETQALRAEVESMKAAVAARPSLPAP